MPIVSRNRKGKLNMVVIVCVHNSLGVQALLADLYAIA